MIRKSIYQRLSDLSVFLLTFWAPKEDRTNTRKYRVVRVPGTDEYRIEPGK